MSVINNGKKSSVDEEALAWGVAFNVNDNLSVSYGERDVDYLKPGAAHVKENGSGYAVAYTMGSMKIAGNINKVDNNQGSKGTTDKNTEIAVSFAF